MSHHLTDEERRQLERDGYVVRERAFDRAEVAAVVEECEALVERVVESRRNRRFPVGSYTFEIDPGSLLMVKWEGESDTVHGLEPLAHLSEPLTWLALDARLVDPMVDLVGDPYPMLYTEKLNLKRPRHGGENPLHQDFPYWTESPDPSLMATAMIFLDDADHGNGTLEVVPGSHRGGLWKGRGDGDEFAKNEIDREVAAAAATVPLEVPAGSVAYFGSLLVHRSAPNRSDRERRSLLYSYQPPGWPSAVDQMQKLTGAR